MLATDRLLDLQHIHVCVRNSYRHLREKKGKLIENDLYMCTHLNEYLMRGEQENEEKSSAEPIGGKQ